MPNNSRPLSTRLHALLLAGLALGGLISSGDVQAQAGTCAANEVTQDISFATNPWGTGSLTYTANIGTGAGAVTVNATAGGANWVTNFPQTTQSGGITSTALYQVDRPSTAATNTITYTFSKPIDNLSLIVTDLDVFDSGGNVYADQATVTGTSPTGATVTPTAVAQNPGAGLITTAGNVAYPSTTAVSGTNCAVTSGDCNAIFNFAAPITTLTIVYGNRVPPAANNPVGQAIGLDFGGFCVQNPNPSVTKTAPASATVGTPFNFALAANNPGSAATTTGLQITDVINATLYPINSITPAAGWSCTPNTGFPITTGNVTVTCTATGTVAAGATNVSVATINVTPTAAAMPGPITNTATIPAGSGGDIDNTNNSSSTSTTLSLPQANLALTKTNTPGVNANVDQAADTVTSGATTTYSITVTNAGPSAANNAVVTDPAPTGAVCSTATCTAAGGAACPAQTGAALVTALQGAGATIPTLPNGGSVTITMTCTVN